MEKVYSRVKVIDKEIEEKLKEVKIMDKELNSWEKEAGLEPSDNYIIYGDTKLDEEEIAFINLPAEHRIIEPSNRDVIETEAEKLATKVRYDNMHHNEVTQKTAKNIQNSWFNKDDKVLDFGRMKVTEFKHNGERRQEELIIEQMKNDYINQGMKHLKTGSKKPTNLTEQEYNGMIKLQK